MLKEHPVGSVCILVGKVRDEYRGMECTIVGGLQEREGRRHDGSMSKGARYVVTLQGHSGEWNAEHEILKLKRFPPSVDGWLRNKMLDLLLPNGTIAHHLARETVGEGVQ